MGTKALNSLLDMNYKTNKNKKKNCELCFNKISDKDKKIEELEKQIRQLKYKIQITQQQFDRIKQSVSPYVNNVNLISTILESITDKKQLYSI